MTALTVWRYDTPFGAEAAAVRLKRLEERKVLTVHDAITIVLRLSALQTSLNAPGILL